MLQRMLCVCALVHNPPVFTSCTKCHCLPPPQRLHGFAAPQHTPTAALQTCMADKQLPLYSCRDCSSPLPFPPSPPSDAAATSMRLIHSACASPPPNHTHVLIHIRPLDANTSPTRSQEGSSHPPPPPPFPHNPPPSLLLRPYIDVEG